MQWDKVKNVLIVILLVVNLFLVGNFGAKIWQNYQRSEELEADLRTLTQEYGRQLDENFRLPKDKVLPILSIDRSLSLIHIWFLRRTRRFMNENLLSSTRAAAGEEAASRRHRMQCRLLTTKRKTARRRLLS